MPAATAVPPHGMLHYRRHLTLTAQTKLQDKEWRGLGSGGAATADASAAFATLVEGLSGCAWSYESETK